MAIQQNFPDEGPTLNLNFAGSRTLDPRITFTRTSSATYMGSDGLIKVAPANSPRFDHRYNPTTGEIESLGLLIEEARTNFCRQSEDFSTTWYNFNSSESVNSTISPDGNLTADKLIPDVGVTNGLFRQDFGINQFPDNIQMCLSVYVKAAEFSRVSLSFYNNANTFCSTGGLDLSNETFTSGPFNATRNIELIGNGWYRISMIFSSEVGNNNTNIRIASSDTGDGTSGIYIWGAQLEAGAFPTSYIPTQGSTATRTADNASMTGSNFSSWYRQDEGTFYASSIKNGMGGSNFYGIMFVDDGTGINAMGFSIDDVSTDNISFSIIKSSGAQAGLVAHSSIQSGINYKLIFSYVENNTSIVNGSGSILTDSIVSIPTVNRLILGNLRGSVSNSQKLNGTISQLTYYPVRLPNEILKNLTK